MNPELTPYDTEEVQTFYLLGVEVKARLTFHHKPDAPYALTCSTTLTHAEILSARKELDPEDYQFSRAEQGAILHYIKHVAVPQD